MGSSEGASRPTRRQGRRWRFAGALLDEASWTLTVDGRRVPIEAKPLELLHTLLLRAGQAISKEELLDAVWPGVAVVEASVPTAMRKLRRALGDEKGEDRIVETIPGLGYRLAVPVTLEDAEHEAPRKPPAMVGLPDSFAPRYRPRLVVAAGALLALLACTLVAFRFVTSPDVATAPVTRLEVIAALRALDVDRLRGLLARGWDPNTPLDKERNGAINIALEICEWNPNHDRGKLALMVRELMDAGGRVTGRNVWGDTPYSIASAPRYCGPAHPVTRMLQTLCFGPGGAAMGNACLASYASSRRRPPLRRLRGLQTPPSHA